MRAPRPPRIQRLLAERVALADRPAAREHGNVVSLAASRSPPAKPLGAYFGCDKVNVLDRQERVLSIGCLGHDQRAAHALRWSWFAPLVQQLAQVGARRLFKRDETDSAHASCGGTELITARVHAPAATSTPPPIYTLIR